MRAAIQDYVPVNQGYLMDFSLNKPPMTVANKGVWMMSEDLPRAAKLYNGVFLPPASARFCFCLFPCPCPCSRSSSCAGP